MSDVAFSSTAPSTVEAKPIVLVTGGSRGIGAALALQFSRAGHEVAILARSAPDLEAAAARIEAQTKRQIVCIVADVTDPQAPAKIDAALAARGFYLDVLVNNAGAGLSGPFTGHSPAGIDNLVSVNVAAPARLMAHALQAMTARRRGGILNVASLGGYAPGPYQAAYYASKAYMISLTEAVASETAGSGIRIAVVAPGPVNTTFHASMGAEAALYRTLIPPMSPARVAGAAYRGFMRGQRVIVPGLINRGLLVFLKILPHPVSVPIVGWLLKPRDR